MGDAHTPTHELALIVCVAHDNVIGKDGKIPWHEPEDLKHFKALTLGHALIMGWRTHASIGRALPGRRNLVLTASGRDVAAGCESFASLEEALDAARTTDDCPFVIGGAGLYAQSLPEATHLYVTELDETHAGDTFFPAYDESAWQEVARREGAAGRLVFRTLRRLSGI